MNKTGFSLMAPNGEYLENINLLEDSEAILRMLNHNTDKGIKHGGDLDTLTKQKTNLVNVLSFGADNTNNLDCKAAFNQAITYAQAHGITTLYIPSGDYYIKTENNSAINIPSNFTILGDGITSVIHFDDNPSKTYTWSSMLFRSLGTSNVTLKSFKIQGSLDLYPTAMQNNALPLLQFDTCDNIKFENLHLEGSRTLSTQIGNCTNVTIDKSTVKNSIRDGFRCVGCSNVKITNCTFKNVADDAITVSSVNNLSTVNSNTIITNNTFILSQGVKALGGKNVIVSNNIFKLCHNTAISVGYLASGVEGLDVPMALSVDNNIIEDNIRFSAYSEGALIIDIQGTIKSTDSNGKIPGFNVSPYAYTWTKTPGVLPPFDSISVTNNKILRTLDVTDKISKLGYGTIIIRNSTTPYNDLAIDETCFNTYGVQFRNCINDLIFKGNIISGYNTFNALYFNTSYTGISLENILITQNIFRDLTISPIYILPPIVKNNVVIENNIFDIDPYFRNTYHNADNTWNVSGTAGTAIAGTDLIGVSIRNNTFLNCYKLYSGTASNSENNIAYAMLGESASSNYGIYDTSKATKVIPVDGCVTSPTFRQVLGTPIDFNGAIPGSGTYYKGGRITNNAITAGGFLGWICTTSGTLGTLNSGGTTGSITSGTNTLTVNSATGLYVGCFITITGVTGTKVVTSITGTTITLSSVADATVTNAAVSYSAAVFKGFGSISA